MKVKISVLALFLLIGTVFCACSREVIGKKGAGGSRQVVRVIDINLTEEEYGIGVDKDQPELHAAINEALNELRESGELEEIITRNISGGKPRKIVPRKLDPSKDQLVVSSTLDFEPFEYGEIGEYYGIDMELADRLAHKLGKELVIINASFEMMFMSVRQHKSDMCIGAITINEKRKKYFRFSDPYFETGLRVAVAADNKEFDKASTKADVEGILRTASEDSVVGVESMTTAQEYCEGDKKKGFVGFPMEVRRFRDLETAMKAVEDGTIEYAIGDAVTLQCIADDLNGVDK